jgi:hypothetical protein
VQSDESPALMKGDFPRFRVTQSAVNPRGGRGGHFPGQRVSHPRTGGALLRGFVDSVCALRTPPSVVGNSVLSGWDVVSWWTRGNPRVHHLRRFWPPSCEDLALGHGEPWVSVHLLAPRHTRMNGHRSFSSLTIS